MLSEKELQDHNLTKGEYNLAKIILNIYNKNIPRIMRDPSKCFISFPIVEEIIARFLNEKDILEDAHDNINNIDPFKMTSLLTYWIAKLKPVIILEKKPDKYERFLNEYLAIAIAIAISYYYSDYNDLPEVTEKLIDDLKYTLRYRVVTGRMLSLTYEFFITGYKEGKKSL